MEMRGGAVLLAEGLHLLDDLAHRPQEGAQNALSKPKTGMKNYSRAMSRFICFAGKVTTGLFSFFLNHHVANENISKHEWRTSDGFWAAEAVRMTCR